MKLRNSHSYSPPPRPSSADFMSACVIDEGNVFMGLGSPNTERHQHIATRTDKSRIYANNIRNSNTIRSGHWAGALARVYVVKSGKRELLRTATVVDSFHNCATVNKQGNNQIITGTIFEDQLDSFNRPSAVYGYRVAAVEAGGAVGAYSDWVKYTSEATLVSGEKTISTTAQTLSVGGSLAAPANLTASTKGGTDRVVTLTWDAVPSAIGYVIDICWQNPDDNVEEEYIQLDAGQAIPKDAHVILERTVLTCPLTLTHRVWDTGPERRSHCGNAPAMEPAKELTGDAPEWIEHSSAPFGLVSKYFLRYKNGLTGNFSEATHSGINTNSFYRYLTPGRTYRIKTILRAASNQTIGVEVGGPNVSITPSSFNVTTDWQEFEATFSVSAFQAGRTAYFTGLTGGAVQVDIASFLVYDDSLNVDDLDAESLEGVTDGILLRDHRHIKPGFRTSSITDLTNDTGFCHRYNASIYTLLRQCQINNMRPHLQIEWHLPRENWLDLIAYLAAPVSSGHPMALKRQAQGQAAPWIDEFPNMILEIGNEAWLTALSAFWDTPNTTDTLTGEAYDGGEHFGIICQWIFDQCADSPYWPAMRAKCWTYLGGWINGDFGDRAESKMRDVDYVAITGYIGAAVVGEPGITTGEEIGASFLAVLGNNQNTHQSRLDRQAALTQADWAIYEAGPSYNLQSRGSEDYITEERVGKSRMAGTGHLDGVCQRAADGFKIESYFLLRRGDYWASTAPEAHGLGTFPSWGLLKMIYKHTGPATVTALTTLETTDRFGGDMPALRAFMFTSAANSTDRVLVALNRDIDVSLLDATDPDYNATPSGTHAMTINTPIASCTTIEYFANVGNFREHNRFPVGLKLNTSGSFDPDPLSVAIDYIWTPASVPQNLWEIQIDNTYGAAPNGLPAGNCILLKLSGCEDFDFGP